MTVNVFLKPFFLDKRKVSDVSSWQEKDTINYQTTKDTAIKKIDDINKQHLKEIEKLEKQLKY